MRQPRRRTTLPSKPELLDLLDHLETVLGDMMRRWDHGEPIDPSVRLEIMMGAYEPVLRMLVRARRRPLPR
jgi:hypothetical protein